jgi:hypothetical protein
MTGAEHHASAELLLDQAEDCESDNVDLVPLLLTALVHAVLAQSARLRPVGRDGFPEERQP